MNLLSRFQFIIIFCLSLIILSCDNPFNPDLNNHDNEQLSYVYKPDSPDNVLRNLIAAYNQKDISIYKSCLSTSFRFQVSNEDVPTIGVDWWGYEQEVDYHKNLFSKGSSDGSFPVPDNIMLNLEIPPQSSWQNDIQEGHENWIIISCPFYLHLYYNNSTDITANGFARFYLKHEDGNWVIAIWVDESNI